MREQPAAGGVPAAGCQKKSSSPRIDHLITRTVRAAFPRTSSRSSASVTENWPWTSTESRTLVDHTDTHPRQLASGAHTGEAGLLGARNRDQHAAGRLGEQGDERICVLGKQDAATGLAGQRGLDDGLRQTAFGQVVRRGDQCRRASRRARMSASNCSRARSTFGGTPPRWPCSTCDQMEPSNSSRVSPSRISVSPGSSPRPVGMRRCTSSITPRTADHRRRQDRRSIRSGCRS